MFWFVCCFHVWWRAYCVGGGGGRRWRFVGGESSCGSVVVLKVVLVGGGKGGWCGRVQWVTLGWVGAGVTVSPSHLPLCGCVRLPPSTPPPTGRCAPDHRWHMTTSTYFQRHLRGSFVFVGCGGVTLAMSNTTASHERLLRFVGLCARVVPPGGPCVGRWRGS